VEDMLGASSTSMGERGHSCYHVAMNFLYHAHSGLRYLVLLAALAALIALAAALATGRAGRTTRILPAVFTGLLDLQVLLGIGLVLGGLMPDIVVGHLVMMIIALVVAHGASIVARRSADERRGLVIRLVGVTLALVIIVGGIMALGRSVFGSAPMTVGLVHEAGQVTSG